MSSWNLHFEFRTLLGEEREDREVQNIEHFFRTEIQLGQRLGADKSLGCPSLPPCLQRRRLMNINFGVGLTACFNGRREQRKRLLFSISSMRRNLSIFAACYDQEVITLTLPSDE